MTRNFKISSLQYSHTTDFVIIRGREKKNHYFSQRNDRCATSALLLAQMVSVECCWILTTAISFIFAVNYPRSIADFLMT